MTKDSPLKMLLPTPEAHAAGVPLAPRLGTLRNKTIGVINNQWWSLNVTLDIFEELLYEKHEIKGIVTKLTRAGVALTREDIEDLAARTDAVICGLGN